MFEAQSAGGQARPNHPRGSAARDVRREIILGRKNDSAALSDSFGERALLVGDGFARAHVLDVRDADVCYDGKIRRASRASGAISPG